MAKKKKHPFLIVFFTFFIAAGITIAYAASDAINTSTNVVTTGGVKIALYNEDDEEVNSHRQRIMPGDTISKDVKVENVGEYAAYIRMKVKKEWLNNNEAKPLTAAAIVPHILEGWHEGEGEEEDKDYVYYYYEEAVSAASTPIPFMKDYTVDASMIDSDTLDVNYENAVGKISVVAEAVQADWYTPKRNSTKEYVVGWENITFGPDYVNSTPVANVVTQAGVVTESSVEFEGDSGKFVSFGGDNPDLFLNIKGLMPGETRKQNITIKNIYSNPVEVYLYAKVPDEYLSIARTNTEWELLRELQLTVTWEDKEIYRGSLFDETSKDALLSQEKMVLLGTFTQGQEHKMEISITLPSTWNKSYCQTKVNWVFTTKKLSTSYSGGGGTVVVTPTPEPTKDPSPSPTGEPVAASTASPESTPVVTPETATPSSTIQPTNAVIPETDAPIHTEESTPTVMPSQKTVSTGTPAPTPVPTVYQEETMIPGVTPAEDILDGDDQPKEPVADTPKPTKSASRTEEPKKTEKPEELRKDPDMPPADNVTDKVTPNLPQEHATKTGDDTPVLFWCGAFVVSLIGVLYQSLYFIKKKRDEGK